MRLRTDDFPRHFTWGLLTLIASTLVTAVIAIVAVRAIASRTARLSGVYAENALTTTKLENVLERASAHSREYFLTGDERALRQAQVEQRTFETMLPGLRSRTENPEGRDLLNRIEDAEKDYAAALERAAGQRRAGGGENVEVAFARDVLPTKTTLDRMLLEFEARKEQQFIDAERASSASTSRTTALVGSAAALALVVAAALVVLLRRGVVEFERGRKLLAESLVRVEQSNRDLDAFAGRVAHDLRNALGPVLLAPSLLRVGVSTKERSESILARLDRSTERAMGLIDALLAFSRAGAAPDAEASAPIRNAVETVIEELEARFEQADATVVVDVEDGDVRCAPGLLYVVVTNLVGNAVKFVRDRPRREVILRGRRAGSGYELWVDDTGPGIPAEASSRVFDPFYRVPGTTAPGTGIGLATVRRIVDAHHGRISVATGSSGGASLRVWLPLSPGTAAPARASVEERVSH